MTVEPNSTASLPPIVSEISKSRLSAALDPSRQTSDLHPQESSGSAPRGSLHHIEMWVPNLEVARVSWGWILEELGYIPFQSWEYGFSMRLGGTYIVCEKSPDMSPGGFDRQRPGLNHLALHSGSQSRVDRLYEQAQNHGWSPLFADQYPWAGGGPTTERPGHYAAFLVNADGFEVELVAAPADVVIRPILSADLDVFFRMEQDREANRIAAFTAKDPTDRSRFDARWHMLRNDSAVIARTILVGGRVAGSVLSYVEDGNTEVTYWIGREFWGRGVATTAMRTLLTEVTTRPLHARAAKDNKGSLTVLQRCGFTIVGEESGFAHGRGETVEEYLLMLP